MEGAEEEGGGEGKGRGERGQLYSCSSAHFSNAATCMPTPQN